MVSHYRIKINEIDTPVETGKSFVFSLFFHLMIIGILLFSPGLLSEKKRSYITSYKVTLVELPKREKASQNLIQEVPVIPAGPAITPQPTSVIEGTVKPPEPIITKPEETKTPPIKMKQKDSKQKSEKKEKQSVQNKKESEAIPAQGKTKEISEKPNEAYTPSPLQSQQSMKKEKQSVQNKKESEAIPAQGKTKEISEKPNEAYTPSPLQSQQSIKKTDEIIASVSLPVGDISLDIKEFPHEWYLIGIKNKIENRWSTLDVKILSGEIKKVIIKFKILRNGRIESAEIEKSSGFPLFDNSALRTVLSSAPLPPLPRDFTVDSLVIHFEFEYKKNG